MKAALARRPDGKVELTSPCVGEWREAPVIGSLVAPGMRLGRIEVLGVLHEICAPAEAHGVVIAVGGDGRRARRSVSHGALLLVLDPDVGTRAQADEAARASVSGGDLLFRAPSSGRFYARSSPDKPPFVTTGDVVSQGQTVAILEVMKTFNRVQYGGAGLPAPARVVCVFPADGDDLESGEPILEVEPA